MFSYIYNNHYISFGHKLLIIKKKILNKKKKNYKNEKKKKIIKMVSLIIYHFDKLRVKTLK